MLSVLLATPALAQKVTLNGAGASFPYPLYTKYFNEYKKETGVEVNYQSIGSGGGQRQILAQTVDFGASDGPMTKEDMGKAPGKNAILHIPTALGAVVPTYNVPGVTTQLKFTGPLLADIFLGKIKTWNDPAIAKINTGVRLPNLPITVVHRSDSSGTSHIFTDYLAKVSPEWKSKVGFGTAVNWPTGLGGKGNEGVAGTVKNTPGSIGYVELIYAVQNKIGYGQVQNKAGRFVNADLKSTTAAAASVPLPGDTRVSITDADGPASYPIAGYTWLLVYRDQNYGKRSETQAKAVKDMLEWVVTKGQQFNEDLGYAELPDTAKARANSLIRSINYGGKAL